jgi:hypothetical protein
MLINLFENLQGRGIGCSHVMHIIPSLYWFKYVDRFREAVDCFFITGDSFFSVLDSQSMG